MASRSLLFKGSERGVLCHLDDDERRQRQHHRQQEDVGERKSNCLWLVTIKGKWWF